MTSLSIPCTERSRPQAQTGRWTSGIRMRGLGWRVRIIPVWWPQRHIFSWIGLSYYLCFYSHATDYSHSSMALLAFEAAPGPITATAFNRGGNIFAYAVSYDWSKGHSGMTPNHPNKIMLHACKDEEVKKRPTKRWGIVSNWSEATQTQWSSPGVRLTCEYLSSLILIFPMLCLRTRSTTFYVMLSWHPDFKCKDTLPAHKRLRVPGESTLYLHIDEFYTWPLKEPCMNRHTRQENIFITPALWMIAVPTRLTKVVVPHDHYLTLPHQHVNSLGNNNKLPSS